MGILLRDLAKTIREGDIPHLRKLTEQIQWHSLQEQAHAEAYTHLGRTLSFLASTSYSDDALMLVASLHQERETHSKQELLHIQARHALEKTRNAFVSEVYSIDTVKQNWQIDFETNTIYRLPDPTYFSFKEIAKRALDAVKDTMLMTPKQADTIEELAQLASEQGEPIYDD